MNGSVNTTRGRLSVLNKRLSRDVEGVYIGRGSKWGNPFKIGQHGTRDEVIEKYIDLFMKSELKDQVYELEGHNLICWCAPLRCHGDFLLKMANSRIAVCEEIQDD
jgi:hypothetical protein